MDDQAVVLLKEIRDLLQRTVSNQEQVLRANEEAMRIYRSSARRQLVGIAVVVVMFAALSAFFSFMPWR